MEAYDLAHKLAYAGRRSPVPFITAPEYTNSVPGVPVLSMVRIFIQPEYSSDECLRTVAREVARVLGATEQYDIGITLSQPDFGPNIAAAGVTARITKLHPGKPEILLRITEGDGDRVFLARYPRLQFEPHGEDFWQSVYAPGAIKQAPQP